MGRFHEGFTSTGAAAGLIALLLTTTGAAVAAPTLVGSKQIKNHSITGVDLKNGAVTSKTIGDGSITGLDVKNGSLSRADVAGGTLTGKQVKDQSLTGADIKSSTLGTVPNASTAGNAKTVNGVKTTIVERTVTGCGDDALSQVAIVPRVKWGIYLTCQQGPKDSAAQWEIRFFLFDSGVAVDSDYKQYDTSGKQYETLYTTANGATQGAMGNSSVLQTSNNATFVEPGGHLFKVDATTQALNSDSSTMHYQLVMTELA